jgi:NADH dehydrogenase [ubiquinone] 1 alpha subcomplex assembly factor 7
MLLVANEVFDALPVARPAPRPGLAGAGGGDRGGRLAFGFGPVTERPELDARFPLLPGVIVEVEPRAEALAAEIGRIGWGRRRRGADPRLRRLGRHRRHAAGRRRRGADRSARAPGAADLTAHVRFRALAEAAGVAAFGPVPQGVLLERLGITERARALAHGPQGEALEAIVAGHRRLTDPPRWGTSSRRWRCCPPGRRRRRASSRPGRFAP